MYGRFAFIETVWKNISKIIIIILHTLFKNKKESVWNTNNLQQGKFDNNWHACYYQQ